MPSVVFLDANVLYPRTICSWLFLLKKYSGGTLFRLVSSQDSLIEATYHFRKSRPAADGDVISRKYALIVESLDDFMLSFSGDVEYPGKDVDDHHIHAAALSCQAKYLVTDDGGFSEIDPDLLPYEVHTSDSFFVLIAENSPSLVDRVIASQLAYFQDKGKEPRLAESLRAAGCPQFACIIETHLERMAKGKSTHDVASRIEQPELSRRVS